MDKVFGSEPLLKSTKEGDTVPVSSLNGKVVGLYFSAHWCGPCRNFTPTLVTAYKDLKAAGKPFEIVFVSADRDDAAFEDYYKTMPWLALDYENRDLERKLSRKFGVEGIPTLVLLDEEGKLITKDGRSSIVEDPKGANFPWKPKPFADLLGNDFVRNDGTKLTKKDLAGKVLGLYFSAHWCGPCRGFTPTLVETYKKIKAAGKPFEIVFVSSDRDESSWKEYFAEMPWLALPFADRAKKGELSRLFQVQGIPTLVILDENGKIINEDGRMAVTADKDGAEFPWHPKPVNDLNENPGAINEKPSVIVMMETVEAAKQKELTAALTQIAEAYAQKIAGTEDPVEIAFFVITATGDVSPQVRRLTGQTGTAPALVLLDIPDNGGYYVSATSPATATKADLSNFLDDYLAKKLTRKQLQRS